MVSWWQHMWTAVLCHLSWYQNQIAWETNFSSCTWLRASTEAIHDQYWLLIKTHIQQPCAMLIQSFVSSSVIHTFSCVISSMLTGKDSFRIILRLKIIHVIHYLALKFLMRIINEIRKIGIFLLNYRVHIIKAYIQ